jgi:hypothetical protein
MKGWGSTRFAPFIPHVGKNSLYRWQERLSDLRPTLLLYALCHQFLNLVVEGDELYTKVKKPSPRGC